MQACSNNLVPRVAGGMIALATGTLTSCGGSSDDSAYNTEVARITNYLSDSATSLSGALLSANSAADLDSVHNAVRSQIRLVSVAIKDTGKLKTPSDAEETTKALRKAVLAHRAYLGTLLDVTNGDGQSGLRRLPAARRQAAATLADYRAFFETSAAPATDGITDVGLGDLKGVRKGLDAQATPAPTPSVQASSAPSSSGTGADYDIVDYSGGEGVRYRYSTRMSDLVPGNGPTEGDQVTIFCYLTGESVRGNQYWAVVDQIEGYVVPATYLRYGHNGPPAGVSYC